VAGEEGMNEVGGTIPRPVSHPGFPELFRESYHHPAGTLPGWLALGIFYRKNPEKFRKIFPLRLLKRGLIFFLETRNKFRKIFTSRLMKRGKIFFGRPGKIPENFYWLVLEKCVLTQNIN
jgi:hypothetical protein